MANKQAQADLVTALREAALDLGRTPAKREMEERVRGFQYKVTKNFGSFSDLIAASGLEPEEKSRVKISSDVFKKNIERHLEEYEPREPIKVEPYPSIALISDIHFPFESRRVIDKFLEFIKEVQPENVVLNGDIWDCYSMAKFPRSHNLFTPREEQALARKKNEDFWKEIKSACKKAKCYQLLGNHEARSLKRVLEELPIAEDWVAEKMKELFSFPGVTTIHDPREELMIGNVMIHHGHKSKLGEHRDDALMNVCVGHTHMGGVSFRQIRGQVLFELNSGLAGDPESRGLSYTPTRIVKWTPGFGYVDKYGPRFIPA